MMVIDKHLHVCIASPHLCGCNTMCTLRRMLREPDRQARLGNDTVLAEKVILMPRLS